MALWYSLMIRPKYNDLNTFLFSYYFVKLNYKLNYLLNLEYIYEYSGIYKQL